MVQTPTMVLFVRDWTILLATVWKAIGKSLNTDTHSGKAISEIQRLLSLEICKRRSME